jgi:hypothetical protein
MSRAKYGCSLTGGLDARTYTRFIESAIPLRIDAWTIDVPGRNRPRKSYRRNDRADY